MLNKYWIHLIVKVFPLITLLTSAEVVRSINGVNNIVGGTPANEQFAFMVQLIIGEYSICGGALISPTWVLTAAHCTFNYSSTETFFDAPAAQPSETRVAVGSLNTNGRILVGVKRITIHPNYDSLTFVNDLALIQLERPLRISSSIQPVPISNSKLLPGQEVIAAGWGQTETQASSSMLLQVPLKISSVEICRVERPAFVDNDGPQLCTGQTPGYDTCPGDSGGPLVVRDMNTQKLTLVGITSFGTFRPGKNFRCGDDSLGFYTRVKYYMNFITYVTRIRESELTAESSSINQVNNITKGVTNDCALTVSATYWPWIYSCLGILTMLQVATSL